MPFVEASGAEIRLKGPEPQACRPSFLGHAEETGADTTSTSLPTLMDIETLAVSLGVGVRHVRRLVAEQRIPHLKVGHYVRFDPVEVARWIDQRRVEALRGPESHTRRTQW